MSGLRASVIIGAAVACACHSSGGSPSSEDAGVTADVELLTLASWNGQLDPVDGPTDDAGVAEQIGGLGVLSAYFSAERAKNPNTALFLASASFGASPPLSSQLADVPAVKGLDLLGAKIDMLTNDNFSQGVVYVQSLVPQSTYPYVATNMGGVQAQVSPAIEVPFALVTVGAVTIGVLGLTDPNAPNKTRPGNFGSITISEPVAAANAAAVKARAAGAQAVVALTDYETTGVGIGGEHTGPLIDFATALQGVDVVVGGNEDGPGTPHAGSTLVVENTSKGQTFGRTTLHFAAGKLASVSADVVVPIASAVTPDPAAAALLAPYRAQLAAIFDTKASAISASAPLDGTERLQETALGDLVADSYLAKYAGSGAQIAIMNGAGIRDALPSSYQPSDETLRRPQPGYASGPPYDLVVGDAYAVLPFGDHMVLRPVTGAVLWQALEQSVFQEPAKNNGFLQIAGFKFTYQLSAPAGARVQSVTLDDGTVIARDDARTFMLVDPSYVDSGGDDYGMLVQTPEAPRLDVDATVLLDYLKANPQITPAVAGRITQVP
jgi:2',3'-cyclic-nucleotide 2'-phosphodiesterase (5'-nucleotidase family)